METCPTIHILRTDGSQRIKIRGNKDIWNLIVDME